MRRYWVTIDDAEEPQEDPVEVEEKERNTPDGNGFNPMSLFGSKEEESNTPTGYEETTTFDPMSLFGSKEEETNTPTGYEETIAFDPMSMFGGEQ